MKEPKTVKAPDGGWGWMVCLGSSLISFSLRALDPSFGLVFHDFLMDLNTDSTKTSFITSVFDANMNFSGLFVGPLLKKFTFRKVAIAGAMLSSIGLILTSRAQTVTHIVCTYSVLTGFGTGLAMAASFVALNNYFDKKRGQAVGFSSVGTAVAMMLMPQLAHVLLDAYAFRGTMLIIGGWAMQSLIGGCLLRPVEHTRKIKPDTLSLKVSKDVDASWDAGMPRTRRTSISSTFHCSQLREERGHLLENGVDKKKETKPLLWQVIKNGNGGIEKTKKNPESEELLKISGKPDDQAVKIVSDSGNSNFPGEDTVDVKTKKLGWFRLVLNSISNFLDLELLKNSVYLNVIFGLSLYNVAESNFKLMTPFFLRSVGMTKGEIAFCLSLTAFTDIVARLVLPVLFDKIGTKRRHIFWISSLLVGIGRSLLAERTKGMALTVVLVLIGFIRGAVILNINLSVSECCTLKKLPHAYGLFMVSKGIFSMTLSPFVGFVRDYSGSYRICIHASSVLIMLAFIAWSIEFSWKAIRQRDGSKNDEIEKVSTIDKS